MSANVTQHFDQSVEPVVQLTDVALTYGKVKALDQISLTIPAGSMVGLIGPDGVGKSSMLSVIAGARAFNSGQAVVLAGDISSAAHRRRVCPRIAYMPQGLGKNLYASLSVEENLQFFGRLFGHGRTERRRRIDRLTRATGLYDFLLRPAGKLSGGMKQKLALCCALIHDPDLLVLDEPTTGVDPLARSQFWDLITDIRQTRSDMSVIVATAYMEEAERFDWLVAMNNGQLLATGTPAQIKQQNACDSLEQAFIALLPKEQKRAHKEVCVAPLTFSDDQELAIEAEDLTMRFGSFTAVDQVSFKINKGEIFGFLGSNGCGKSTTMKMLTGLLVPSAGKVWLFDTELNPHDIATRRRVGYMSQSFSLYSELTIQQNLVLHARLFHVPEKQIPGQVDEMVSRFGLGKVTHALPNQLPLGVRQRLSLAVAMIHKPELLILDEPTSGVDPIARDQFWQLIIDLARNDKVTIFISTHFMNEAERCDRMSLMHAGQVLASGAPSELIKKQQVQSLEEAFIHYLEQAQNPTDKQPEIIKTLTVEPQAEQRSNQKSSFFSCSRAFSYSLRESLELLRDPVRGVLALLGSLILLLIMAYGISMDVNDLNYAILDRDQTALSRSYALNLSGSRYFNERLPLFSHQEIDQRMQTGELTLVIEIPPHFGRDLQQGKTVEIGACIDGAMPTRAETVKGYTQGLHQQWLQEMSRQQTGRELPDGYATIATRYRYNPEVKSLPSIVPAVVPLLLLMIPSMLTVLSVVREKELGSIINLYVTPVTRMEFLFGKQLPYILLALINFLLMVLMTVTLFQIPIKGSFLTLFGAAFLFIIFSTGVGLFASVFTRSQIAAMLVTVIGTMLPAIEFSGLINPVSSLTGAGALIGRIYPATHFLTISRGVFNKALAFGDLQAAFFSMALAVPVILGLSILLLKKQEK